jgi:DNA helicase II / ATP-dependent DNA helicase PcrA
MTAYLEHLNDVQRQAVLNIDGPCMIIAGAGSGKTNVLTCRIAYLMQEKQVNPFNILALTFTNKAAQEMHKRLERLVGNTAKSLWLGTFHSIFVRILRIEADRLGYPHNFSIYDSADSKSLIKAIVKEMELDDQIYNPNVIASRISAAKNRLVTAQQYINDPIYQADDQRAQKPQLGTIFLRYVDRCLKAGAMDFDDLLLNTYLLFSQYREVLYKYQERFRYILIDEFQDTNLAQYAIVKSLAATHQNICIVGDDAQSIYAFRGADIRNILDFEKDHPNLRVVKLEQNYRSTQNIVGAANSIISHNKAQLKKSVWTANESGELVSLIRATTDTEEGQVVANSIFELKHRYQLSNENFAVLYRTNSQSRAIEEALRKVNIPYRILGGISFYQRKEVKDLLAYLRFVVNYNDEEAFKRIINLPKRGIGATSVEKVFVAATDHGISLWEVLSNAKSFLDGKAGESIQQFGQLIQGFSLELDKKDAYELATDVAQKSGLLKALYEDKTVEGLVHYENVQELLNAIKVFTSNPEQEDISLSTFLQEVALAINLEEKDDQATDKVSLMTIHAAKGLEFKYVYIVGMEEDLFPSGMMLGSREDLEEERRLFYVALTRAQKKAFLIYTLSRYRFGRLKSCEPSRFLNEIDRSYLHTTTHTSYSTSTVQSNDRYAKQFIGSIRTAQPRGYMSTPKAQPSDDRFTKVDLTLLKKGTQVEHPKFGIGTVMHLDLAKPDQKAQIDFAGLGEKTLLLSFAKLKILSHSSESPLE